MKHFFCVFPGSEVVSRCLLERGADMWLTCPELALTLNLTLPQIPSAALYTTSLYFVLLKDHTILLRLLLEFGCMKRTYPQELLDTCIHLGAGRCLRLAFDWLEPDRDLGQLCLSLASMVNASLVPVLLECGVRVDGSMMERHPHLLEDVVRCDQILVGDVSRQCAAILTSIRDNMPPHTIPTFYNHHLLSTIINRLDRKQTVANEDLTSYYTDLDRSVGVLVEANPSLLEHSTPIQQAVTVSHHRCQSTNHSRKDTKHLLRFIAALTENGFPLVCPCMVAPHSGRDCILLPLVAIYLSGVDVETPCSASADLYRVMSVALSAGCLPWTSGFRRLFLLQNLPDTYPSSHLQEDERLRLQVATFHLCRNYGVDMEDEMECYSLLGSVLDQLTKYRSDSRSLHRHILHLAAIMVSDTVCERKGGVALESFLHTWHTSLATGWKQDQTPAISSIADFVTYLLLHQGLRPAQLLTAITRGPGSGLLEGHLNSPIMAALGQHNMEATEISHSCMTLTRCCGRAMKQHLLACHCERKRSRDATGYKLTNHGHSTESKCLLTSAITNPEQHLPDITDLTSMEALRESALCGLTRELPVPTAVQDAISGVWELQTFLQGLWEGYTAHGQDKDNAESKGHKFFRHPRQIHY